MDCVLEFMKQYGKYISIGVAVIGTGAAAYKLLEKKRTLQPRICGVDYPKDTIILHAFARDSTIPNIGHFVMKLETYLRINKLPYEADCVYKDGPKEKQPWIEYNGITMGDSQLIIQFLEKEFKLNLNSHLTNQERATAWAIQKWLEEFTYWLNVHTRWVIFFDEFFDNLQTSVPKYAKSFWGDRVKRMTYECGLGRHTNDEIHAMMVNDLKQFSEILGQRMYLMGSKISDVDCAAFGVLSQIRWTTPDQCPGTSLLKNGELQNVTDYLDRIKSLYWPDWDELTRQENKYT